MDGYVRSLSIDVNAENNYQFIKAKQGDKTVRAIAISLLKDGASFAPTGVSKYSFRAFKPDGNAVVLESSGSSAPIVADNGVYTVTLSEQCLAVAGRVVCDLAMTDSSGNVLSSATFVLDVVPMPDIGSIVQSSTEWLELQEAIEKAEGLEILLRSSGGYVQYSTDGTTWTNLFALSDIPFTIASEDIDAFYT